MTSLHPGSAPSLEERVEAGCASASGELPARPCGRLSASSLKLQQSSSALPQQRNAEEWGWREFRAHR